ncbi:MAG: serine/threonine-protein kinase [Cyanobacteria bacterium P01_A01_bin.83]
MSRTSASALKDGVILNNRYRIVKEIGRGGFGRAYLAEDTQRYRELCVLKEFAPQVKGERELNQAEDLFEREAGILYKLNNPQIPKFEALLKTRIDGRRSLFLVQEYIEGKSYWQLLQRQGRLTEKEVTKMMLQVLPVLDYIHNADLIHRDISPDNLIRRDLDEKTVLIDFGCVKLAANAVSKSTGHSLTLIGKQGYSPPEQLHRGQADRTSDLYSLAVSAIVLLTGKSPDQLYNHSRGRWDWKQIEVSSRLTKILTKMLSEKPRDRYQSATQVLQMLPPAENDNSSLNINSFISRFRTLILAPGDHQDSNAAEETSNTTNTTPFRSQLYSQISRLRSQTSQVIRRQITRIPTHIPTQADFKRVKSWQWGMITAAVILVPGLISFALVRTKITASINSDLGQNSSKLNLSPSEQKLQQDIYQKLQSLDMDEAAFYTQVDQTFYEQHPELAGVQLTDIAEHQPYRETWYQIAVTMLEQQIESR